MTIRHLRIFVAVAETGKMSAAAERCFVTQPTVSQAVRELEDHYKTALFDRLSKKLYITEAGEQLLSYARKTLSQFDVLEANMAQLQRTELLRIGATITVGACLLSSVLNDLKRLHPELRTYACVANTSVIERKLLSSELDVGLVEGIITSPELTAVPVVDDFLVLAAAKDHPLASRREIHVSELADWDFVMREKGSGTRRLFEEYLERRRVKCRIAWEATCLDAFKSAILYNGCIAAVSARLVENEATAGRIHVIRSAESEWNRSFYLVCHKDRRLTVPMRSLQDITRRFQKPGFLEDMETGTLVC